MGEQSERVRRVVAFVKAGLYMDKICLTCTSAGVASTVLSFVEKVANDKVLPWNSNPSQEWNWDYVLNLSESDYPVKPLEELVKYLSVNSGRNFVKSHGRESSVFVRKQGLDRAFVECDTHLWRLGPRKLPLGVQVDGGSDWVCLHRDFVRYVVEGEDETISKSQTNKHIFGEVTYIH